MITKLLHWAALASVLLLFGRQASAQTNVELLDVLSPYNLSVTLLANGDFSIRTGYNSNVAKHIIYQQDGTSTIPTNYTSHVHFRVDTVLFQLPFEEDTALRLPPPPHPLVVTSIYHDTIASNPRIDAAMFGVMPDGDTLHFILSFEPSKRSSGGFIKISAQVRNTSSKSRAVGSLFFFDTQIDTNDASPIATAFGYSEVETDFIKGVGAGMPEFWLALEGTPRNPMLTARGNLKASGLIEPDYMIFGSWTDIGLAPIFRGLNYVQWNERVASHLKYKDSGVLLRWDPIPVPKDRVITIASTEIGIIDSLQTFTGVGGGGGGGGPSGGGMFGAGPGGCASLALNVENPCGQPGYSPYSPDSVQLLYLLSNTDPETLTNVTISTAKLPPGITSPINPSTMIPADLPTGVTGVGTISLVAAPRLRDTTFYIPLQIHTTAGTATIFDTVCLSIPGILPTITVDNIEFAPLCPGTLDSLDITLDIHGVRCLPVDSITIVRDGNAGDVKRFSLTQPMLDHLPGLGKAKIRVAYSPDVLDTQRVRVITYTHEFETFNGKDTTFFSIRDTSIVTGFGKNAEFSLASKKDALVFGKVCVGDSSVRDWPILNIGGCTVTLDSAKIIGANSKDFVLENRTAFPLSIPRASKGSVGKATIRFMPGTKGIENAQLVVWSADRPFQDTLVLRGFGDAPSYVVDRDTVTFDTICPGVRASLPFTLTDTSVCTADIDSITISSPDNGYVVQPSGAFSIAGNSGTVVPQVGAQFSGLGNHVGDVVVHSALGDKHIILRTVIATRALDIGNPVNYGDVLVGGSASQTVTVRSTGTAGVLIRALNLVGNNALEYKISNAVPALPAYLSPGASLKFDVTFVPSGIENRTAEVIVDVDPQKICDVPLPLALKGRGTQPLIDVGRKFIDAGKICVGDSFLTAITVRNFGNAPLSVTGLDLTGSSDFAIHESLPVRIDSAASHVLQLQYIPSMLGPQSLRLHITSNGTWVTAPDTMIVVQGTGVLCGIVSVDTIHATLGVPVDIPVRYTPHNSSINAAAIMNTASATDIGFHIAHNAKLLRFANSVSSGMIAPASPIVTALPASVSVRSAGALATNSGNIIATLRADPLLGDDFETPLTLSLDGFAKGYSQLTTRDGLLFIEGCALDQRYVAFAKTSYVVPASVPLSRSGSIVLNVTATSEISLDIFDAIGHRVARLKEGMLISGTYRIGLSDYHLASGFYLLRLNADGQVSTTKIMVE